MSNRKFLEDNENIQGEGRPTRYAASQDQNKQGMNAEQPTTWLDWLGIFGMMCLTYLTIILIWTIGRFKYLTKQACMLSKDTSKPSLSPSWWPLSSTSPLYQQLGTRDSNRERISSSNSSRTNSERTKSKSEATE